MPKCRTYYTSGFENFQYFAVNTFPCWGVNGSLNGIYCVATEVHMLNSMDHMRRNRRRGTCVEDIFTKLLRKLHEVALDKLDLVLQPSSLGIPMGAAELEFVVVQADDFYIRKTCYLSGGTTDATANVENTHPTAEGHLRGEIVFVASEGCGECLALVEAREVERLGPTVLIELRRAVVVA